MQGLFDFLKYLLDEELNDNITLLSVHFGLSLECYSCGSTMDFSGNNKSECEDIYDSYYNTKMRIHCIEPESVCAKYIVERK